jgi:transcriptional regulator with XRE-family HTH domain/3-methyladenine DNA glycosylase AlkC
MKKQFIQLLQRYIDASGVKRVHVASVAGISYNYLARLLAGTRNPSDQVVNNLARALHLTQEQTAELLSAAGFVPPLLLVSDTVDKSQEIQKPITLSLDGGGQDQLHRLIQQFYRLGLEVSETLQPSLLEEMRCLLSYARYKYILSGGQSLLDLHLKHVESISSKQQKIYDDQNRLDVIAQIIGELHTNSDDFVEKTTFLAEDTLSTIDHLVGNLLTGEISATNYHPQLVGQTLDMLQNGAPWEIRRRIAEALPSLCRLDRTGTERLMEALRVDFDEIRGPDIRRRVVEALPSFFDAMPQSSPMIVELLQAHADDDIYVALATIEACGDIQVKAKSLLGQKQNSAEAADEDVTHRLLPEIARIQRQTLMNWAGDEQECLQFSMALHNLLPAPDTLLISLEEGLQSQEMLMRLVTVRYLERVLPVKPAEVLKLYRSLLHTETQKNIRRSVGKAFPALLQCLRETSLSVRALARSIILTLADDSDVHMRRTVADHAMHIFSIDREFLLELLRRMHKEKDPIIRYRLRPVALRLAQTWLIWYAETAKLVVPNKLDYAQAIPPPFEE